MLTCNVNGAGSLSPSYQWDRVGGSSRVSTSQELTRDPLRRSEDGDQYRCTVTISSSLGSRTFESTEAIRVTSTYACMYNVFSMVINILMLNPQM